MTSTTSSSTPLAEPTLDTSTPFPPPSEDSTAEVVESPSLSSGNALARFEFEAGKTKDCTKILLVEWEDDAHSKTISGDWEISWEGKKTVLPARDEKPVGGINRLYFLLGPGLSVPSTVRLEKGISVGGQDGGDGGQGVVRWKTNPLPAIFSPELGMSATQKGKKGVLHTVWAKKRLQVLKGEIEREERLFGEGIALEMARAEMEWIESNFGVKGSSGSSLTTTGSAGGGLGISTTNLNAGGLNSPASPRSPGGGRLMDKLKGLKIGTSERELSSPIRAGFGDVGSPPPPAYNNPLSPESSDVAVGSFGSFAALKGMSSTSELAAKPPQPPTRKMTAQSPPESFAAQQRLQGGGGGGEMGSLNAFASPEIGFSQQEFGGQEDVQKKGDGQEDDDDDDLFALPMSPRSPEMSKSPFSFAVGDTNKYAQGERAG